MSPGIIKTEFSKGLWVKDERKAEQLMGVNRLGVPEDVAKVVSFLLSKESEYING